MAGDLLMGGNLVKGLPTDFPPRGYIGNEAISWTQARQLNRGFATERYVNSKIPKPVITIWAEEKGALSVGALEWSFGNGSDGLAHALSGYTMMAPGRIIRMGLSLNLPDVKLKVAVTVNQAIAPVGDFSVTKDFDTNSGTAIFSTIWEVNQGDRINFQTREIYEKQQGGTPRRINGVSSATGIVCLLIELDL